VSVRSFLGVSNDIASTCRTQRPLLYRFLFFGCRLCGVSCR
jgi:hypothetical protein